MVNSPYFYNRQPKYPSYNNSYYGGQMDQFKQQMPNQNAFSANGSFNQSEPSSQGQSWAGKQDWIGGISSGLAAGAANSEPDRFTIDQYAGFKGSGQGLMGGGVIGAIVGGITAQAGQFSKVNKALKNLDTSVQGVQYDAYGRPVYGGESVNTAMSNVNDISQGENKLNKTHIDPATNLFSSAYGTRRKLRRKREELQRNIESAQQQYNQSDVNYRKRQNELNDYYERINTNNRLYNLYRSKYE